MSDILIHRDWDREKAEQHLADLQDDIDRHSAIADAFRDAAEEHERTVAMRVMQYAHCVEQFTKPRMFGPVAGASSREGTEQ